MANCIVTRFQTMTAGNYHQGGSIHSTCPLKPQTPIQGPSDLTTQHASHAASSGISNSQREHQSSRGWRVRHCGACGSPCARSSWQGRCRAPRRGRRVSDCGLKGSQACGTGCCAKSACGQKAAESYSPRSEEVCCCMPGADEVSQSAGRWLYALVQRPMSRMAERCQL